MSLTKTIAIPPQKVVVGLSGGVDSSVAAKLLKDQGYEVIGVFLKNWEETSEQCIAEEDLRDAENIAKQLEIPFFTFNFSKQYWNDVFEYFLKENRLGRTPNPDILCNKYIKFGIFHEKAKALGADYIATGHYAKKVFNKTKKAYELHIPADTNKDQTYFLHAITQKQLARSIFPLENLKKKQVREIAQKHGFTNHEKKDSTGICFIGKRNYSQFLQQYLAKTPGNISTPKKQIIGKHIGLSFYTIGQRKELDIGGQKGFPEKPWFVIKKDLENNVLIVSQDETLLFSKKLTAQKINWITTTPSSQTFDCEARIRYRQAPFGCTIKPQTETQQEVIFQTPQRAIAPGQSIVFYDHGKCLGGGEIQ